MGKLSLTFISSRLEIENTPPVVFSAVAVLKVGSLRCRSRGRSCVDSGGVHTRDPKLEREESCDKTLCSPEWGIQQAGIWPFVIKLVLNLKSVFLEGGSGFIVATETIQDCGSNSLAQTYVPYTGAQISVHFEQETIYGLQVLIMNFGYSISLHHRCFYSKAAV